MATSAPAPTGEDDILTELVNLIVAQLGAFKVGREITALLYDRVSTALEVVRSDPEDSARLLELQDNCRVLGQTISEIASEEIGTPHGDELPQEAVQLAFGKLCPGFYPFC